jgi:SAM-dependent methyltransferase
VTNIVLNQTQQCPVCSDVAVYWKRLHDDRHGFPGYFVYYRCPSCGLVFHKEHMSPEQIQNLYSTYYPRAAFSKSDWHPHAWKSSLRSWLDGKSRAYMYVPANVRVLDIGCGFGESLGYHRNRGCSAHGTELDLNAQRIARAWNLDIRHGTFDPRQWSIAYFDYVTLDQVLEHNADPITLLCDIRSVLKPGGSLILTTPNADSFTAARFGRNWIHYHPPYHVSLYTYSALNIILKKANFKVRWMRTVTPSAWLQYQYLHKYFAASEGKRSRFWDPREPKIYTEKEQQTIRTANRLLRYRCFSAAARILDACNLGDNLITSAEPEKMTTCPGKYP